MGMFSWECKGCGHPLLSPQATNQINSWMRNVVAVCESGETLTGMYDGYGRISGVRIYSDYDSEERPIPTYLLEYDEDLEMEKEDGERDHVSLWHEDCWKVAGEPPYNGPSENAQDQGYFFEDPDHDMERPWPSVERKLSEPEMAKEEGELPPKG